MYYVTENPADFNVYKNFAGHREPYILGVIQFVLFFNHIDLPADRQEYSFY
jgi:hypothetical protein